MQLWSPVYIIVTLSSKYFEKCSFVYLQRYSGAFVKLGRVLFLMESFFDWEPSTSKLSPCGFQTCNYLWILTKNDLTYEKVGLVFSQTQGRLQQHSDSDFFETPCRKIQTISETVWCRPVVEIHCSCQLFMIEWLADRWKMKKWQYTSFWKKCGSILFQNSKLNCKD